MKNYLFSIFLLCIYFLSSCQHASSDHTIETAQPEEASFQRAIDHFTDEDLEAQRLIEEGRKIIKTANYKMQVKDVEESLARIEETVQSFSGFIANMDLTSSSYQINNKLDIKVPNTNFEALLKALDEESIFTDYKKIHSKDITEEYLDLQSRLKTKKTVKKRYEEILRSRASTIDEILNAEEKIRYLQEEIEAKEGRLRYLQHQVRLSQIHLHFYQTVEQKIEPQEYKASFADHLQKRFSNGWGMILSVILSIVNVWPLAILGLGFLFFKRKWLFNKIRSNS